METQLLFVHGRGSSSETWKKLISNIPDQILSICLDLTDSDFSSPSSIKYPSSLMVGKWIIITHSIGVVVGLHLSGVINVSGMILIDPTPLDDYYLTILEDKGWDIGEISELSNVIPQIPIHIHFQIAVRKPPKSPDLSELNRRMYFYQKYNGMTFIHPNCGHFVHLAVPDKIIYSIKHIID